MNNRGIIPLFIIFMGAIVIWVAATAIVNNKEKKEDEIWLSKR